MFLSPLLRPEQKKSLPKLDSFFKEYLNGDNIYSIFDPKGNFSTLKIYRELTAWACPALLNVRQQARDKPCR
jgi:hypothetical protein